MTPEDARNQEWLHANRADLEYAARVAFSEQGPGVLLCEWGDGANPLIPSEPLHPLHATRYLAEDELDPASPIEAGILDALHACDPGRSYVLAIVDVDARATAVYTLAYA